MARARILVVDCIPADVRPMLEAQAIPQMDELEVALLKSIAPDIECDTLLLTDLGQPVPGRAQLDSIDGVLWSGTPLSVTDDVPGMRRQLDFMRVVFDAGMPVLGICGGLQVAVEVAGGKVARNPKGLESGIARRIQLTAAGRRHPLFQFREGPFDAICDHFDYAEAMPADAEVLAFNEACPVQALAFKAGQSEIWAVQYHADYSPAHLRALSQIRKDDWQRAGLARDEADVDFITQIASRLERDPRDKAAAWLLGIDAAILDPRLRSAEVRAWVKTFFAA